MSQIYATNIANMLNKQAHINDTLLIKSLTPNNTLPVITLKEQNLINEYNAEKKKLEFKIVNNLFVKNVNDMLDKTSLLHKKFKCTALTYKNYTHDFAGRNANIHEVYLMMQSGDTKLMFNTVNNRDTTTDHEYLLGTDIYLNAINIYHDCKAEGGYFEECEEFDNIIEFDKKLCNDKELNILNMFLEKVKKIF